MIQSRLKSHVQYQSETLKFDRFYRAEDGTTKSGAGLGLSIAKQLVIQHKGEIYATSEYGKGSTFSVFLPQLQNEPKIQHPE